MVENFKLKQSILWIGFGSFAKRLYPYVEKRPEVKAVSFFYPDKKEAVKRFGEKAVWDMKKALAGRSITAVFITTPNDKHTKFIRLALKAGKHIFVEKPITALYQDAVKLLPLMRRRKTVIAVGHHKRREVAIRKAKELIEQGKIGSPVSIYTNWSKGIAFEMTSKWRSQKKRHREGPLVSVGIHLVEVLHYLLGPVESVSAVIKNVSGKTEAPDSNAVLLNFKNGTSAFLEANYCTPSEEVLNIYGTEGTIYINRGQLALRLGRDVDRKPSQAISLDLVSVDALKEEIDEFFEVMAGRKNNFETGYREAINALAVIEACYQSSTQKKIVAMKKLPEYF